jgi:serine/threonine protein kinase
VSQLQPGGSVPPDLPGYRFMRHIGSGGNAQVYLYEQDLPRRDVAVKVLNESALADAARRRFTAEANVTAGLAHRHIVQVFDAKVTGDGRPYIVMPYYPRPNLLVRARRAHLSVADVLRIGIQIGSAVETSHRRGVLHRDIKPQNILTDSYGEPALTDFGIATTKGGDGPEGLSVPWSPPEILYGAGAGDQRSDVYSLGATLWHVLAGRSPFEQPAGDNRPLGLMGRIRSDPVPPTGRADVPDSLERLLRQAMAKDPAARPQTAMDLIRGLQSVEQELRLPLTQPILPAGEPVDTSWGDTSIIPAVRIEKPGPARPEADDPTRARSPRRIDPWSPPPSAPGGSGGRVRQFPPEAPESATLARPRAAATQPVGTHADDAVAQGRGTSGRILALAGGGVLLAAVLAAAVLVLGHSHGSTQAPAMTAGGQPGIAQDALGVTPGKPTVTARSIGRQRVEFSWVYTRSAPSDSFVVQVNGGSWKPVTPRKPDLVLSVAQGQRVCIQVQVVSSGGGEGSPPSSVSCWPAS